jgi:hypothetical protein
MPDKPSDIRSLKTSALTAKKNRLSKSSKHKQIYILWSSGLHAFNFSVKHFTQLEKGLNSRVLTSAWRWYLRNFQHQPHRGLANSVGHA